MGTLIRAAVVLLGVVLVLRLAPADAALAPSSDFAGEGAVALQPIGPGLLLLTDQPTAATPGVDGSLLARTGTLSGSVVHWSAPVALSAQWKVLSGGVHTATASNGLTAVAWSGVDTSLVDFNDSGAMANGLGRAVVVTVRMTDGTWQAPVSTSRITSVVDVTIDTRGDVVVLGYDGSSHTRTLVRDAAGEWRVVAAPRGGLDGVVLDGRGTAHGIVDNVNHGGDGWVGLSRLPAGAGRWTRTKHVRAARGRADDARLLVSGAGHETLVVGSDSPRWASTYDTDAYFATSYSVLQRRHGHFVRVWHRDGAQDLRATLGAGGRLQLLWTQDRLRGKRRWPTRYRLVTQQVLPTAGPATRLSSGATYRSGGTVHSVGSDALFLGTSAGTPGVGVLWRDRSGLHAWWNGVTTPLPESPAPSDDRPLAAVGTATTAPVVAWISTGSISADSDAPVYVSATTSVAQLTP